MTPAAGFFYDARPVGNWFLDYAGKQGKEIDLFKLHSLLYLAQGNFIILKGRPLFIQDFEYSKRGPEICVIQDQFKHLGKKPVLDRIWVIDVYTGEKKLPSSNITSEDKAFLKQIFDLYSRFNNGQLFDLIAYKGSAWDKMMTGEVVCAFGRISLDLIREDFLKPSQVN